MIRLKIKGIIGICIIGLVFASCSSVQSITYEYRGDSSDKPFPAIKIMIDKDGTNTHTFISLYESHYTVDKKTFHAIMDYSKRYNKTDECYPEMCYSWGAYGMLVVRNAKTDRYIIGKTGTESRDFFLNLLPIIEPYTDLYNQIKSLSWRVHPVVVNLICPCGRFAPFVHRVPCTVHPNIFPDKFCFLINNH
jgi:hypothetical protein